MPIDWNQAQFVDPKLQIVGEQLPVEAAMKTGDILQGRYDKAMEMDTKLGALKKKLMGSVDPADQELAKQISDTFDARLNERKAKGDYQNMQWQTTADAEDFANIYTGLVEKAKTMQKYRDYINTTDKISNQDKKKWELEKWAAAQAKSKFDPENRFVSNLNVEAPKLTYDYDMAKAVDAFGKGFEADLTANTGNKYKSYKEGEKMKNGVVAPVSGIYDVTTGHKVSEVKASDIERVIDTYMKNTPEAAAYKDSEIQYYMSKGLTEDEARQKFKIDVEDSLKDAAGIKYGFKRIEDVVDQKYDASVTNAGITQNSPIIPPVTVNSLADSYGIETDGLRSTLVAALKGEKGKLHTIIGFFKELPKDDASAKTGVKILSEIQKLTPAEKIKLAKYWDIGVINDQDARLDILGDPKLINLAMQMDGVINLPLQGGSKEENAWNKAAKENVAFQNVNMTVPALENAEQINKMNTWMKTSLSNNDFKPFKGKIDSDADYQISKVSDRPLGNGTGIVIELKDNKTNKTILVEAKDSRLLNGLEKVFPGISTMDQFKETTDFNKGEKRTIQSILDENHISNTGMPPEHGELQIQYGKDNLYHLLTKKGHPVTDDNGQEKVSTNYIDLL